MAESYLAIYRRLHRFPLQSVIYVGDDPLRMQSETIAPAMSHRFELIDFRTLDADSLLESPRIEDNLLAILAQFADRKSTIQAILDRVGTLPAERRAGAIEELLVIANLRKLEVVVEEEAKKMPSLDEVLANAVLGREYNKGRHEGRHEGRREGETLTLRRMIERRFGPIPAWAAARLEQSTGSDLERISLSLLDARSLEELFP
jgi:predicted transposase YdaD